MWSWTLGEGEKGGETFTFLHEDPPHPRNDSAGPVPLRTSARTYCTLFTRLVGSISYLRCITGLIQNEVKPFLCTEQVVLCPSLTLGSRLSVSDKQ